jgi:hypothetical protein
MGKDDALTSRLFDPHILMYSRTTDDYDAMSKAPSLLISEKIVKHMKDKCCGWGPVVTRPFYLKAE